MKPILPYSILLSIAISPLALAASYTQISNQTYSFSDPTVLANTGAGIGAVQVTANGVNTILQGNVNVANTGNGGNGLSSFTGSGIVAFINVNNVTSDVNITTNGASTGFGYGIIHYGSGVSNASKITIDAGVSNLNVYTTGAKTGAGYGITADTTGKVYVTAKNVTVDYTSSGTSTALCSARADAILDITAEKVTAKGGWRGVWADSDGVINITGNLDASTTRTADGIGVYAQGGGYADTAITVSGHTDVSGKAQFGVQAYNKGTVTLKGGLTANQATLGATAAVYAYGGTVKDDVTNGAAGTKYDVSGQMKAQTYSGTVGTIDLHMGAGSTFTGYTTEVAAADVINLELSNGAQWTNTAASTMSNLSLLANSTIAFNEIGTSDAFYNINSVAVMLAEGSLLKIDLADTFTGDVTLFSGITNTGTWNGGTDVENAILLNAAGTTKFIYTNPSAGVFRITGSVLVPEPTTASLTLLGLTALMMRRRRVAA